MRLLELNKYQILLGFYINIKPFYKKSITQIISTHRAFIFAFGLNLTHIIKSIFILVIIPSVKP